MTGKDKITCIICNKTFDNLYFSQEHLQFCQVPEKKYECAKCSKSFSSRQRLNFHIKNVETKIETKSGEKSSKSSTKNLQKPMQIKKEVDSKEIKIKKRLKIRKKKLKSDLKIIDREFKCEKCSKIFSSKTDPRGD